MIMLLVSVSHRGCTATDPEASGMFVMSRHAAERMLSDRLHELTWIMLSEDCWRVVLAAVSESRSARLSMTVRQVRKRSLDLTAAAEQASHLGLIRQVSGC